MIKLSKDLIQLSTSYGSIKQKHGWDEETEIHIQSSDESIIK